jgi:site-specific DNA recombinase
MIATTIKTVAIYARQSSGAEQDDKSDSIQMQVERLTDLAKRRGWTVARIARDANTSGRTYPDCPKARALAKLDGAWSDYMTKFRDAKKFRPGLAQVMAELPNLDAVLVYDGTRLMRPLAMSYLQSYLQADFVANGVSVCTLDGQPASFRDFATLLTGNIDSLVQDRAIRLTSEKANTAKAKRQADGKICDARFTQTYGYRYTVSRGVATVAVDQTEAQNVRQVFQAFADGTHIADLLKGLNGKRVLSPKGKQWTRHTLEYVLKNVAYIGKAPDGQGRMLAVEGITPIVDERIWNAVQERFNLAKRGTRQRKYLHPLSGLLRCGSCGGSMVARPNISSNGNHNGYRYACSNVGDHKFPDKETGCRTVSIAESAMGWDRWHKARKVGLLQAMVPFVFYGAITDYMESLRSDETKQAIAKAETELNEFEAQITDIGQMVANKQIERATLPALVAPI